MKVNTKKLVILSKSKFCYISDLNSDEKSFITFRTASDQYRNEFMNKTKLGILIQNRLSEELLINDEIGIQLWKNVLNLTEVGKTNVIQLGNSLLNNQILELLNQKEIGIDYTVKYLNLELTEQEFKWRCSKFLEKTKQNKSENFNAIVDEYWKGEIKRKDEIFEYQTTYNIKFKHYNKNKYKASILH